METAPEYLAEPVRPRLTVVKDDGASYSALPHEIMRDTKLSRDARLLYAILQGYAWQGGECRASHETLAREMGCSTRMLRTYLNELLNARKVTEHGAGYRRQKVYRLASIGTVLPIEAANEKPASDSTEINRKFPTGQSEISDTVNRKQVSDSKKKTPEKKKQEELQPPAVEGAGAPTAAAPDQATILRGLSDGAREILDWHRQCHGRRSPAKLNPESARVLEAAVADLGVERLRESVRFMAGKIPPVPELSKAISAAKTKRQIDEGNGPSRQSWGTPRNGTADRLPPGAASKQKSSWSGFKGRYGSNLDPVVKPDGR